MPKRAGAIRSRGALKLIGRRWMPEIIRELSERDMRFCDINDAIPKITNAMLSRRLRELDTAGVVNRTVVTETHPPECWYGLSRRAKPLKRAMLEVSKVRVAGN